MIGFVSKKNALATNCRRVAGAVDLLVSSASRRCW